MRRLHINCCSKKKKKKHSQKDNKKWMQASTEVWIELYGWKDGNGKIVALHITEDDNRRCMIN